jgi:sugar lactone lactonase YvrE
VSTFYSDGSWTVVNQLEGLAFDPSGNCYVASNRTNTIEKITPAGVASVFASNPSPPSDPNDPANPSNPQGVFNPIGLAFDGSGDLFVANYHYSQLTSGPYSGDYVSYIDEYSATGTLINAFTNNHALTGNDPTLRDANYIAIKTNSGVSAPEGLEVTSTSAFTSVGGVGGPFAPGTDTYALTNSGSVSLPWSASATQSWLSLSATSGTLAASGSSTVTASINPNANALASGTYSNTITFTDQGTGFTQTEIVSLTVVAPPVITSALTASGTSGSAFSYQITASNSPSSFAASNLPTGLSVNTTTGLISGTATTSGTSSVTISAGNAGGVRSATLVLSIVPPPSPAITSSLAATAISGVAFNYLITASNNPTSFGASGLPSGLSVNTATGLISGTVSATGTSDVTISAANPNGSGTATLVLIYAPAGSQAYIMYISYGNGDSYVEEYSSSGTSGVNTDLGPLPSTTTYTAVPNGIAFDSQGNLYVANDTNGTITKFAPNGSYLGVFASGLSQPAAIAFDNSGNLYAVSGGTVVKITPAGVSSVFASSGLSTPQGLAFGPNGNLYVTNQGNNSIVEITPAGQLSTFYQDGSWTIVNQLEGLAFDTAGNCYVASYQTNSIEKITPAGVASVFANNPSPPSDPNDPANPTNPEGIFNPIGLAFDPSGDLFVANFHHTQLPGLPYEGHGISYMDEFSSTGVLIDAFTSNPNLPGADANLRDGNYIAIRPNTGGSAQPAVMVASSSTVETEQTSSAEVLPVLAKSGSSSAAATPAGQTVTEGPAPVVSSSIKKILAADRNGPDTFFLATLQGQGITAANDIALEAMTGGTPHVVAAKGETVATTRTITTLTTLAASPGTLADGRWRVDDSDFGIRVTFAGGGEAIYVVPAAATSSTSWSLVAETGAIGNIAGLDGAFAVGFGLPGFSDGAESYLVDLAIGPGEITAADDVALASGSTLLAQKGTEAPDATGAPMTNVLFKTLSDPVSGANGAVAFEATLAAAGVPGGATGIWFAADGVTPRLIAMTGDAAPGGGHFAKFISMVLPAYTSGSGGPIFTATLTLSVADGVTGRNNLGLWAVDATGAAQLLFRSGESLTVGNQSKTVSTFSALEPISGSSGAACGYDNQGNISVLATFTDGTQKLLNVAGP